MNVEFFIYGTPLGYSYWGKEEDKAYFDTMYNNSNENKMLIEIRRSSNGILYCYYNYLIYIDVIDSEGRPGSFLGISLRLDAYCSDIRNMYRLLDTFYYMYIKNTLVKKIGEKTQFIVGSFKDTSISKKIEELNQSAFELLKRAFTSGNFQPLDSAFSTKTRQSYFVNLYDYSETDLQKMIWQTGKLDVSPDYPTIKINQVKELCDKNLQNTIQQYEVIKKRNEEKKEQLHQELAAAREREQKQESEIKQLKQDIHDLRSKLKSIERAKNVEQLIEHIKVPIAQIADYFTQAAPPFKDKLEEQKEKWLGKSIKAIRRFIPFLNMCMLILLLSCVFQNGMFKIPVPLNQETDNDIERLKLENDSLKNANRELEEKWQAQMETEKDSTNTNKNHSQKDKG